MGEVTNGGWRERLRIIIFEAETPNGKLFDEALLVAICLSIVAVMLESVDAIHLSHGRMLRNIEWGFTALFSIEYLLRLICVPRPIRYARSFFGIIDLLSILPSFISLLMPGSQSMLVLRAIRLLRIFRILKLARFLGEASILVSALRASRHKIFVFVGTVLVLVLILGTSMYLIEGQKGGFSSIPRSMYWAIVTMTTVGYGDITPQTIPGQMLASIIMIIGYGIIAIPTGIVTAEMVSVSREQVVTTRSCTGCLSEGHSPRAHFCQDCGEPLPQIGAAGDGESD